MAEHARLPAEQTAGVLAEGPARAAEMNAVEAVEQWRACWWVARRGDVTSWPRWDLVLASVELAVLRLLPGTSEGGRAADVPDVAAELGWQETGAALYSVQWPGAA